jgi:hypothetical protein
VVSHIIISFRLEAFCALSMGFFALRITFLLLLLLVKKSMEAMLRPLFLQGPMTLTFHDHIKKIS